MLKTVKLTISLPKDLEDFASRFAAETKRSRSQVFADLLAEKRGEILRLSLIEGYRVMAEENSQFTREAMPLAAEVWGEVDYKTGRNKG